MILFALLGVPACCLTAYAVDRWLHPGVPAAAAGIQAPSWHLLWGFLYGIPCHFLARLLGRLFAESYRPFPLYLHLLGRDHLFQAGLLAAAFFGFLRDKSLRQLLYWSAGYYCLLALGAVLAASGLPAAYELFLLPALRMSALLLLPFLFRRARDSFGRRRVLLYLLLGLVPLAGGLTAFLFVRSWEVWSALSAVLLLGAALAVLPFLDES